MCARSEGGKIKPSARKALAKSDFLYLSTLSATAVTAKKQFDQFRADLKLDLDFGGLQIITREDFPVLLSTIYGGANVAQPVTAFPPLAAQRLSTGKWYSVSLLDALKHEGLCRQQRR